MTRRRKALTWLLSGATFVFVIALSGCASRRSATGPDQPGSQTPAQPVVDPADPGSGHSPATPELELVGGEANPPKVNIFGEFDGVQRTPGRNGGQAGFQQHTYLDDGYDGDVAVDAKGQRLVFSSTRHSEHSDLYLQKVDGLSVTQLTSDDADDAFPVFSPDDHKLAFCSTRAGNWDIYLMDTDGKNVVQVTSGPMQEIHPSFSPDGNRLVYSAQSNRSGQWELWTVNLLTNEKRMIGFGLFPSWSPARDKDQIAFQKARARGSRWFSLWTLDLIDGDARQVTEVAVSSNAAVVSPAWSPDGHQLSFATIVSPAQVEDDKAKCQQDIWTINADGTNRHRITDGNGASATPYWAADNRIYFISDRSGKDCIWSASAEQGGTFPTAGADTKELED